MMFVTGLLQVIGKLQCLAGERVGGELGVSGAGTEASTSSLTIRGCRCRSVGADASNYNRPEAGFALGGL